VQEAPGGPEGNHGRGDRSDVKKPAVGPGASAGLGRLLRGSSQAGSWKRPPPARHVPADLSHRRASGFDTGSRQAAAGCVAGSPGIRRQGRLLRGSKARGSPRPGPAGAVRPPDAPT
jgi:hypothetical protein